MSDEMSICPRCKEPTEHESVDVGVGIMHGPEYCSACGWTEYGDAGKVIDGYYHDVTGSAYPVESADARVEALKEKIAELFTNSRVKATLALGGQASVVFRHFKNPGTNRFSGGRSASVELMVNQEIKPLVDELSGAGWSFEFEFLPTGHVHADVCNSYGQLAMTVAPNDTSIGGTIQDMLKRAHERWVSFGRPTASKFLFEALTEEG